ncbi:TPA: hypothetical protein P0E17_004955 [Vibrio campbellii]|nr:hypothetical protein [Vibrio parahaemolyticus]HDM8225463.1 hypothetical protein [Vibrio campbellii]
MSNKSKKHLISFRIENRLKEEYEELKELNNRDVADFLRDIFSRGLYSYRNDMLDRNGVDKAIYKSLDSYQKNLFGISEELEEINERFDKLENMINSLAENKKGWFK